MDTRLNLKQAVQDALDRGFISEDSMLWVLDKKALRWIHKPVSEWLEEWK